MSLKSVDFLTMDDFDFRGKTVFVRLDVNSPVNPQTGEILSFERFYSHVETIESLEGSKIVLLAHQSRPGKADFMSLRGHARAFSRILGREVKFIDQLFGGQVRKDVSSMEPDDIIMLENTRFYSEELLINRDDARAMRNSNIVKGLSDLMDYYIIDAFPAIHRPQTTLIGFRSVLPNIAGKLIEKEVEALQKFKSGNGNNKIAILAGAKISDSINVAGKFLKNSITDTIITGGVVANAFLWAKGIDIGKKNREFIVKNNKKSDDLIEACRDLLSRYGDRIVLPSDFILMPSQRHIQAGETVPDDETIADIGIDSIATFSSIIEKADAIFLNGPLGMYEFEPYAAGTESIFYAVANSNAHTVVGGGHTIGALNKMGLTKYISHVSTGGGALISYLSGDSMPVLEALAESKKIYGS